MAGYDPKRPRPSTAAEDDPAPVEALLEPTEVVEDVAEQPSADADVVDGAVEVDLREASTNGSSRSTHEVPVAPAPEEGTANRAVLVAAFSGVALVVVVLGLWFRRRRRG